MATPAANVGYGDFWRTKIGEDLSASFIDMGEAKYVELPKIESPEAISNQERVERGHLGK